MKTAVKRLTSCIRRHHWRAQRKRALIAEIDAALDTLGDGLRHNDPHATHVGLSKLAMIASSADPSELLS